MDGFILINKEIGETSNNVVQKVKKALKAKKVGHLGTLDPIAEGLLILAVNKATKFSSYFLESDKSYEVKVELGKSTDTDDLSGKIIGMIDNTKEQADVILEALGTQLRERFDVAKVIIKRKDHYSKPAPDKMIEDMSREVDVAIAALGG